MHIYPRTLYEWTASADKALKTAIASGKTVYELAQSLQREPVSVLRRLDQLDLCPFEEYSEEWAEVMSLALANVPLEFVIGWCTAAEYRLPYEMFASFSERDLAPAFALARDLHIIVANADALDDLVWLAEQPHSMTQRYSQACTVIQESFDVITPTTLKHQVLGITPPRPAPFITPVCDAPRTSTQRTYRKKGSTYRRRAPSTTSRTRYAKSSRRYSTRIR